MATDVIMPKLSDTMEDGKILRWLKKPGEAVAVGDVLAEVETDKADMELEAEHEGVLSEIVVAEGASAAVGQVIARLGSGAEALAKPSKGRAEKADGEDRKTEDEERAERPRAAKREEPEEEGEEEAEPGETGIRPPGPRGVSPQAQKLAREKGIDLAKVTGSGPGGRVVERDLKAVPERGVTPGARRPPGAAAAPKGRVELSKIRRTVARRMTESKRDVPHFYTTAEIEMQECARLKESLAAARREEQVSYTHLLLRGVALALEAHPRINARYLPDDAIEFSEGIHLGIAVALDEGLIVPVLHDCARKSVFEIAAAARALVERVRSGKAQGDDLSGGTFTVSNLGMFSIEEFAAVINPPQAAVLAVGSVRERPIVRSGAVVAAPTMKVTLSSDHRVIDGAEAARFLETLKELLENPVRLVL